METKDARSVNQWVYLFREGNAGRLDLLGSKGADLAEMTRAGMPIPPGFTISAEACSAYHDANKRFPESMWEQVVEALKSVEQQTGKGIGDKGNPLLISTSVDARFSDSVDVLLNLGLNDETVQGLATLTNDERFAYDAYCRFIQQFSRTVLDKYVPDFEEVLDSYKARSRVRRDDDLPIASLKRLVVEFKCIAERQFGEPFPTDIYRQLHKILETTFFSWNSQKAIDYRNANKIPQNLGIAVTIQSMVFGNMGTNSGNGVAFTRNPNTGAKELWGVYLPNTQRKAAMSTIYGPSSISRVQEELPQAYLQLQAVASMLEQRSRDVQEFKFTIECGHVWLLKTELARRSAIASLRFAMDLLDEGLISTREVPFRVQPEELYQLLLPKPPREVRPFAYGEPASAGTTHGKVIFVDGRLGKKLEDMGEESILIITVVAGNTIDGILQARGVITYHSGFTIHAVAMCRNLRKPCIARIIAKRIHGVDKTYAISDTVLKEGDEITIDGSSGAMYLGAIPIEEVDWRHEPDLARFIALVESMNTDDFIENGAGLLWALKDVVRYNIMRAPIALPKIPELSSKDAIASYISFVQPPEHIVNEVLGTMFWELDADTTAVVWGIMHSLKDMLLNEVGIGNHHRVLRPLIDPQRAWFNQQVAEGQRLGQLIGLEFFSINHYLRNCLPWGEVQFWIVASRPDRNFVWRLDTSNPYGESLVLGDGEIMGFLVVLNGQHLTLQETKIFYNELRKRSVEWRWYLEQQTSWREVVDTLRTFRNGEQANLALLEKYRTLGLVTQDWQLSAAGVSLLVDQAAAQRRNITFAGRKLYDE